MADTGVALATLSLVGAEELPVSQGPQRTYGDHDRETAFHVWHGPAGHNLSRTAAMTGYPLSTVHRWRDQHGWEDRADALRENRQDAAARSADAIVQQLIAAGQVPAIVALHEIVADPSHRDRYRAAVDMLGLGGRVIPKQSQSLAVVQHLGSGSGASVAEILAALDPPTPLPSDTRVTPALPPGTPEASPPTDLSGRAREEGGEGSPSDVDGIAHEGEGDAD